MPGCNAPAPLAPPQRAPSPTARTARRLPADGNRRPAQERCAHHSAHHGAHHTPCAPAALPRPAAAAPAPLWTMMMERWLAATP